eukprot:gb/GECG01012598.1/.p1 GENE.gb/GECG01012598.1/~~gb/GECG01012598.1/.p1  ORF type:complete len:146 (+),score=13.37 gb/GECG01012598.1/:1-438(+)
MCQRAKTILGESKVFEGLVYFHRVAGPDTGECPSLLPLQYRVFTWCLPVFLTFQKSVVEATYTAHMEYFPDSKEVECITYVLQNPADTGDFYAVSQEQLLEEYKLAVRRGILSLWQHSELSQVLKASNATSLAEALTSQIVPKRQ